MELKNTIQKSQHCQRNWDLNRRISDADLEVLKTSVTQCPSKQNLAYYQIHFIKNRTLIEELHKFTRRFTVSFKPEKKTTNSQVMANLLVLFESLPVSVIANSHPWRNHETLKALEEDAKAIETLEEDQQFAIGVAAGYLNLTAHLLGLASGFCTGFERNEVKRILNLDFEPTLMIGVGFPQEQVDSRRHHLDSNFSFPAMAKQEISFSFYDD